MLRNGRALELVADELSEAAHACELSRVSDLLDELRAFEDDIDATTGRSRAALIRDWQLLVAARRQERRLAETLIEGGADPDGCEATGIPIVAEAAFRYYQATIEMLVELGADINGSGPHKRVVALDMALERQPGLVRPLLALGADPNIQTRHFSMRPWSGTSAPIRRTPVATAFARGLGPFIQLVDAGGRIDEAFPNMSLVRVAAEYCWADRLDYLRLLGYDDPAIHEHPHLAAAAGLTSELAAPADAADIDLRDQHGRTPVVMAVCSGRAETVRWLLDRGADPNQRVSWIWTDDAPGLSSEEEQDSPETSGTRGPCDGKPLVAVAPTTSVASLLLNAGADPNQPYSSAWSRSTAAHDTSIPESVMRVLFHGGLDPSGLNAEGDTPLHVTCNRLGGDLERTRLLLRFGVDPDSRNACSEAPLHRGSDEAVHELIRYGADVNAADDEGQTPLMTQTMVGSCEAVVQLLVHGADPGLRDRDGRTAVDHARTELGELSASGNQNDAGDRMKLEQVVELLNAAGR